MTLDLVLDAVVGDLAQAPVKRGAVGQTTRGCLLSNDHENPPSGQHTVKPGKCGQRSADRDARGPIASQTCDGGVVADATDVGSAWTTMASAAAGILCGAPISSLSIGRGRRGAGPGRSRAARGDAPPPRRAGLAAFTTPSAPLLLDPRRPTSHAADEHPAQRVGVGLTAACARCGLRSWAARSYRPAAWCGAYSEARSWCAARGAAPASYLSSFAPSSSSSLTPRRRALVVLPVILGQLVVVGEPVVLGELVVDDVLVVVLLGWVVRAACTALSWSAVVLVVAGGSYEAACASDACAVPGWLTGRSRSVRSIRVVACPSRPWRFLRMMMSISPGRSESGS